MTYTPAHAKLLGAPPGYVKMNDAIGGGFQSAHMKNPDGTQGPHWHLCECGYDCVASPGCHNCPAYKSNMDRKHRHITDHLLAPLRWTKRQHVLCCPEGDLYHPSVPDEFIYSVFAVMVYCYGHRFFMSTKRPERMAKLLRSPWFRSNVVKAGQYLWEHYTDLIEAARWDRSLDGPWGSNIILGVSAEDQEHLDMRAPYLLEIPEEYGKALMIAPMLGPMVLGDYKRVVDWIICGAEKSSKVCRNGKPRPFDLRWAIDLANQFQSGAFYLSRHFDKVWASQWLVETYGRSHREFPRVLAA